MPGMFMSIFCGAVLVDSEDERDEEGILIPFMLIPRIPFFLIGFLLLVFGFDLDFGLLLDLLPMLMPGIFCMSLCARAGPAATLNNRPAMAMAQNLARKLVLILFMTPSQMVRRE
jgi:hypothetical protein